MEKRYSFQNQDQIISMGGPWACDLYYDGAFVARNVLLDNLLFSGRKIYFVWYHPAKRRGDAFFTIGCWDYASKSLTESIRTYDMLYLKEIRGDREMVVCNAFHGELPGCCSGFTICQEAFRAVIFSP